MRTLKAYIFDISPHSYGEGFVIVLAYTLKQAQKLAAIECADTRKPESFIDYKIVALDKAKAIHYSYYAE
jgi:hypothetical protein